MKFKDLLILSLNQIFIKRIGQDQKEEKNLDIEIKKIKAKDLNLILQKDITMKTKIKEERSLDLRVIDLIKEMKVILLQKMKDLTVIKNLKKILKGKFLQMNLAMNQNQRIVKKV